MTVSELIEELKKFDGDIEVITSYEEGSHYGPVTEVWGEKDEKGRIVGVAISAD